MANRLDISLVRTAKEKVRELGGKVNVSQFGAVDYKGRKIDLLVVEEENGVMRLSFRKMLGNNDGVLYTKELKPTPTQVNNLLENFVSFF